MLERPGGADLLAQARADFEAEILPHVPRERRYTALMVLRAMEVAGRDLEAGEDDLRRTYGRLAAVFAEEACAPPDGDALERAVEALAGRLVREIREGRLDEDDTVAALLRDLTEDALRRSNPKVLEEGAGSRTG